MKKIYYTVEKELQDVDGFEEVTGWKYVTAYHIENNEMVELCQFKMDNTNATVSELMDNLSAEIGEIEIQLIQL